MLSMTYVRPDRVMSTSVLEPTTEGYQPVQEAQAVAERFTRIYGPTVVAPTRASAGLGYAGCCGLRGPQEVVTTPQAVAAIAKAFAAGQAVRLRDSEGNVVDIRQPFWSRIIGWARTAAAKMQAKAQVKAQAKAQANGQRPPAPQPGAIPTSYGWAPSFNRASQAAQKLLPAGARPPQSIYLPAAAGAQATVPNSVTAAIVAKGIPGGVPGMIAARGQANAFDWFNRTGRYY